MSDRWPMVFMPVIYQLLCIESELVVTCWSPSISLSSKSKQLHRITVQIFHAMDDATKQLIVTCINVEDR